MKYVSGNMKSSIYLGIKHTTFWHGHILRYPYERIGIRVNLISSGENSGEESPSIFAVCGPSETEELGAQMAVDLLEQAGFDVSFAGGNIPSDEVLAIVHENKPDVLLTMNLTAVTREG